MRRKIIFRGRKKDGDWLYGNLIFNRGKVYIAPIDKEYPDGTDASVFEVDADSVGEFTGVMQRKSGEPIYEGDVVRFYDETDDELVCGIVEWLDYASSFVVNRKGYEESALTAFWSFDVIGNIYDNPNMIEYGNPHPCKENSTPATA